MSNLYQLTLQDIFIGEVGAFVLPIIVIVGFMAALATLALGGWAAIRLAYPFLWLFGTITEGKLGEALGTGIFWLLNKLDRWSKKRTRHG
jgi:hypothetical protein